MKRTTIIETIIFLFLVLFLYTGISKIADYSAFKENISESPMLASIATPLAWSVPLTEFLVTIMLLIPRWRLKGLYAALALMITFTCYVIAILIFNDSLPCSCGGILQQLSWPQHIAFNGAFIIFAMWGIKLQRREIKVQHTSWSFNGFRMPSEHKHSI